jgi:hypothetical protein
VAVGQKTFPSFLSFFRIGSRFAQPEAAESLIMYHPEGFRDDSIWKIKSNESERQFASYPSARTLLSFQFFHCILCGEIPSSKALLRPKTQFRTLTRLPRGRISIPLPLHLFPPAKNSIPGFYISFRLKKFQFSPFTSISVTAQSVSTPSRDNSSAQNPVLRFHIGPRDYFFGRFHFRTLREVALCKDFIFQGFATASRPISLLHFPKISFSGASRELHEPFLLPQAGFLHLHVASRRLKNESDVFTLVRTVFRAKIPYSGPSPVSTL